VSRPILLNRELRKAGLLSVRSGPFGEHLDTFGSRAFAVCDHQIAHVYVTHGDDRDLVRQHVTAVPGVARVLAGAERGRLGLDHPRAGDLVVLSQEDAWFAYPYWIDDRLAPDFARTVDIHRKPGYDPCELYYDPRLVWPKGRALVRWVQKKLGFRTLFDVIPLDPALVRGSHGVPATRLSDRPLLIGDGPAPATEERITLQQVHELLLQALIPP
jgi:hypothetical protein